MPEPQPVQPSPNWEHFALWQRVREEVLPHIPKFFRSTIQIAGISATEIYTFGAMLGAVIEEEVVRTLNELRERWDPEGRYSDYVFERQPQRFPDVLLLNKASEQRDIIFGLELKSWYLLAKEGEPSFRFTVTPQVCTEADLLVVVPWALSFVVAGTPVIFKPFIASARYVAEYRNYWWQEVRKAKAVTTIRSPRNVHPYPKGREKIADLPREDPGRNFGRIARIGIMDDYVSDCNEIALLGIKVAKWREFFRQGSYLDGR